MTVPVAARAAAQLELRRRQRLRYQEDPVAFAKDVLRVELTPQQEGILESVRDDPRTWAKAANGVGKTFISSVVVCWWIECFDDSIAYTTAPNFDSVKLLLWKEIRARHAGAAYPLRGTLSPKAPEWYVGPEHFAVGKTSDSAEGFQGQHAERLLIVMDEGPGIEPSIYTAGRSMLKGPSARLLTIGNPTILSGDFYDAFHGLASVGSLHTLSAEQHPNVVAGLAACGLTWDAFKALPSDQRVVFPPEFREPFPGAVSLFDVDLAKVEYGTDSADWAARIEGEFPDSAENTMVSRLWVEQCAGLDADAPGLLRDGKWAGLDVARYGSDRSVLMLMDDGVLTELRVWQGQPTDVTSDHAQDAIRAGYRLNLDDGGIGGAVTDNLRRWGFRDGIHFNAVDAGSAAQDKEHYPRMRDELWGDAAKLLRTGQVSLARVPKDKLSTLTTELTSPVYKVNAKKQREVEPKDETKKRLRRSPDLADAFNLALHRPKDNGFYFA